MESLNRKKYDDIFVILTYRNKEDIIELLESIRKNTKNTRTIIVNSYYDDSTKEEFRIIAQKYVCDFVPVDNRGYGAGNNAGMRYALEHYDFKRLVISNPDVEIVTYNQQLLDLCPSGVYAGEITNLNGKQQNPLRVYDCNFTNDSNYYLLIKKRRILFYLSVLVAKIQRLITLKTKKKLINVFAVHGSFFAISESILKQVGPFFDEKIFMFQEEIDIAKLFKQKEIPVMFTKYISVIHKEDGDIGMSNMNHSDLALESCLYIHQKWQNK